MVTAGLPSVPLQILLLAIGYSTSGLLSLGVAVYAFRRRDRSMTAGSFAVLLVATSFWCLGFMARVLAGSVEAKLLWLLVGYVGLVSFPPALLVFSLYYTGKGGWVTRRTVALLLVAPVFFVVAMATNSVHTMFFTDASLGYVAGWPLLSVEPRSLFWLQIVYNYLVYLSALLPLAGYALDARGRFRSQATLVLVAFTVLWLVNVGFVFGLEPFPEADPTPIAVGVCASILALAVVRVDFVDIVPVARERVLESVEDGVLTVDDGGRVVDVNRRAESVLGVNGDEAIGCRVEEVLPAEIVETEVLDENPEASEGEETQVEVRLEDDKGEECWLWVRRFPLPDSAGLVLILTDITRRKRREEQLARQNERLDRIAGVVSHDLRNPMDVIKKRGTLARETGADQDFDAIDRSVERMDALLDDMLQLARQGRDIDEREEVELDAVARSAWHTVDTKDAELVAETGMAVSADKSRLRQAFENLFRNALEHGGDDVRVTLGTLTDEKGEASGFYVEDDGPGVPPEKRDEVFEYGWTSADDGNGFGLAIVRDVVEAHGWRISAVEGSGGGARFEVSDVGVLEDASASGRVGS